MESSALKCQVKVALMGWTLKKDTNDIRESYAIYVAEYLPNEIFVYDGMVTEMQIYTDLDYLQARSERVKPKPSKVVDTAAQ